VGDATYSWGGRNINHFSFRGTEQIKGWEPLPLGNAFFIEIQRNLSKPSLCCAQYFKFVSQNLSFKKNILQTCWHFKDNIRFSIRNQKIYFHTIGKKKFNR
jgi:hypothetical protein